MKTQTFGIEVEMNHISRQRAAEVIAAHFGTRVEYQGGTYDTRLIPDAQGRKWKVVSDSSIDGPSSEKTEFVSPICKWEDIETVQALIRALRDAGGIAVAHVGGEIAVSTVAASRGDWPWARRPAQSKTYKLNLNE